MAVDRLVLDKSVPGWLPEVDFHFFDWFLDDQQQRGVEGDLVELGVYLGKSAIVIGDHLRPGEKFTVVDLFDGPAGDEPNQAENASSYPLLSQGEFEKNYRQFHRQLPVVHHGFSSEIRSLVADGSVRFVHVDASHLYDHVSVDVRSAHALLNENGVVAFDDYRSPHTPGVAAAVWEAVVSEGLHPLLLTSQKLYATWADPAPFVQRLTASMDREFELQSILGHDVIRVPSEPVKPRAVDLLLASAKARVPQPVRVKAKAVLAGVRRR